MNITKFSIQRPIGICMVVAFFVVLGLYSYWRIGVELLPEINTPYVSINVKYAGASAESVEQEVIKPLEDALSSVSGVKRMTSTANAEKASILLEMELSTNADYAAIDASKKVNAIRQKLPDDIDEPVVSKWDMNTSPILEIAVLAPTPLGEIYTKTENTFVDRIQQVDGVADVELNGGRDREIAIEVNKDKLAFYRLSLEQVTNLLKSENKLLPAGTIYTDVQQSDVRLLAQYQSKEEITRLKLKNLDGVEIPLTAFATIKEQDARVARYARVNGEDAVTLTIYKNSDANVVATADGVLEKIKDIELDYPQYRFVTVVNSGKYVKESLHNTLGTLFEGLLTTSLVLYFFLRGWRSMVAVMIAIPTSLISTFFMMYIAGFTFNMMSLMGMALCIGILVDDSIVVLENIHRHMMMGKKAEVAAEEGRTEIGMAAVAITLCDIVVFMPIAFMSGFTGRFFCQFGMTIVFATLFSLFVSFTLTPMLSAKFFSKGLKTPKGKIWIKIDAVEKKAAERYEEILTHCLAKPKKILGSMFLLFVLTVSFVPLGWIGMEYMPKTDEGSFTVSVQMPVGQTIDQTDAVIRELEKYVKEIPEVSYYLSGVGRHFSNSGSISVTLCDRSERSRDIWEITEEVRKFAKKNILTAQSVRVNETQSSVAGVSGGGGLGMGKKPVKSVLELELKGTDNEALVAASYDIQDLLKQVDGVKDISSSYSEGMPEVQLEINRDKLNFYHITVNDITNAFSAAIAGKKAGDFVNNPFNDGQDTSIKVRFEGSDGYKVSDIGKIPILANNRIVFLGDVVNIKEGVGPVTIRRVDRERSINIQANLTDRPLVEVMQEVKALLNKKDLGNQVHYRFTGQADSINEAFIEILQALGLALILVYMILAFLYESLLTPFIRMFSLPLGMIGSLLFLLMMNQTINIYSLIGILVMDGLVAKNGTLLLDYAITLKENGKSAYEAIIEAGKIRMKPIFMTTLTMVVGMLPTALAMTEGSETRVSMAWVIIGGLLSSTIFTLIVIPIIFVFFDRYPVRSWFNYVRKEFGKAKKC
ncbi:efflux RND transporter permease subunit [Anaerosinus sp.]